MSSQETIPDQLVDKLRGMPVKVTDALPYVARTLEGENLGRVHWFAMSGFIWVSQEFYNKIKEIGNGQ